MNGAREYLRVKFLKTLEPLGGLSVDKLEEIANKSHVEELPPGRTIFRQGEKDNRSVYLLSGQLELHVTGNPKPEIVKAKTVETRYPIAQEWPRPSTCRTKTNAVLLYIDSDLLEILLNDDPSGTYEVMEIGVEEDPESDWMLRFLQSPAFLQLPTENIQKILMKLEEIPAKVGDVIVKQGESDEWYYIVKQGKCSVSRRPAPKAEDVRIAILGPGDGFGEEALITQGKRNATVTVKEAGKLMRLNKADFHALLVKPMLQFIDHSTLTEKVRAGAVLIDVRTNKEFTDNGIKGAQNIPLSMLRVKAKDLNVTREHIVYCNDASQSAAAAFLLAQKNIQVFVLNGGLNAQSKPFSPASPQAKAEAPTPSPATQPLNIPTLSTAVEKKPTEASLIKDKEYESHKRQAQQQAHLASQAEQARIDAEAKSDQLREQADSLRMQADTLAKKTADAEAERKKAEDEINQIKQETLKQRDKILATAKEEIEKEKQRAKQEEEQIARPKSEAELARQRADAELKRIHNEAKSIDDQQSQLTQELKQAEVEKQKAAQAAEVARLMAKQEADKVKAEAESIRQTAMQEAERLRSDMEQRRAQMQAEESAKKEAALSEARQKAELAMAEAAKAAEDARRQATLEAETIRKQALKEAEKLRLQVEQEKQQAAEQNARMKAEEQLRRQEIENERRRALEDARNQAQQEAQDIRAKALQETQIRARETARRQSEEEALRKQNIEEATRKAMETARLKAEETAEAIRLEALAEAKRLREEMEATKLLVESEAKRARAQIEEETARRLARETNAREEAERIAQLAAEQVAKQAAEEAERRAIEEATRQAEYRAAEAAQRAAEEAERRAKEQAILAEKQRQAEAAARQAAEEAERRAAEAAQHAAEEAERRTKEQAILAEKQRKAEAIAQQKAREQQRLAEEKAHKAKQMAKQLKQRMQQPEEMDDRYKIDETSGLKLAKAKLHVIKDKTVLEGEEDIFIFKAPSERPPSKEEAERLLREAETQLSEKSRRELPSFDLDYADDETEEPIPQLDQDSDFSDSILLELDNITASSKPTLPDDDDFTLSNDTVAYDKPKGNRGSLFALTASIVVMVAVSVIAITQQTYVEADRIAGNSQDEAAPQRGLATIRTRTAGDEKAIAEDRVKNEAEQEFHEMLSKWRKQKETSASDTQ